MAALSPGQQNMRGAVWVAAIVTWSAADMHEPAVGASEALLGIPASLRPAHCYYTRVIGHDFLATWYFRQIY